MNGAEIAVEQYYPRVRYLARKLRRSIPPWIEEEDLVQEGMLALLEAKDRYKPECGNKFITFAQSRAYGAMIDSLRGLATLPRRQMVLNRKIKAAEDSLAVELKRSPEPEEIAARVEITLEEYYLSVGILSDSRHFSLTHVMDELTGEILLDRLVDKSVDTPEEALRKEELKDRLLAAIAGLDEREQRVILLHYIDELSITEIGPILGCSQSRVSQIHAAVLRKLRIQLV